MAIVKILSRHSPSYRSLIAYILKEGKGDEREVYTNNLRGADIDAFVSQFMENEAFRRQTRSDQIYLFHEIVSFHAEEDGTAITKETVDNLVAKYMGLRGDTGVMLAAAHRDKDHVHIHFCVSALHYRTGKSFGLNRAQLNQLKTSFQEYHREKFPELTKSHPEHGKGTAYRTHAQWHTHRKQEIAGQVQEILNSSASQRAFLERLREAGLHHYERGGRPTGIEYEGQKFRFSRLLEGTAFEDLPVERSEEDTALAEIRAIREIRRDPEREREGYDRER
ncbi:relaxase/mobilization nuclease domain-containing protein [Mucilaginibacter sp. HD30]